MRMLRFIVEGAKMRTAASAYDTHGGSYHQRYGSSDDGRVHPGFSKPRNQPFSWASVLSFQHRKRFLWRACGLRLGYLSGLDTFSQRGESRPCRLNYTQSRYGSDAPLGREDHEYHAIYQNKDWKMVPFWSSQVPHEEPKSTRDRADLLRRLGRLSDLLMGGSQVSCPGLLRPEEPSSRTLGPLRGRIELPAASEGSPAADKARKLGWVQTGCVSAVLGLLEAVSGFAPRRLPAALLGALAAVLVLAGCDGPQSEPTSAARYFNIDTWTDPDSGCRYIRHWYSVGSYGGLLAVAPKFRRDGKPDCPDAGVTTEGR